MLWGTTLCNQYNHPKQQKRTLTPMAKEEAEEKAKAEEEEEEGRTKKRTANCTKKLRTLTQDQEPPGRTAGNH